MGLFLFLTTLGGKESARVIFLGDSITAGYNLDPEQAYPALVQKKATAAGFSCQIVNAGLSGDTTAGGVRRIDWVLGRPAEVLVIALGGNDGLRGLPTEAMESNLRKMIERARELYPDITIILAGMQMPGNMGETYTREFREVYERLADTENVILLPFLLDGVGGDPEFNLPDRIHPNERGQQVISETVWEVLGPVLKERREASGD